jgi:hypothetical protein
MVVTDIHMDGDHQLFSVLIGDHITMYIGDHHTD